MSRPSLALALAFALASTIAGAAWAADEAVVLRTRAEQLAAEDRCEEALPRAERARELAPRDARAALVAGRCELRLGRYREAIDSLSAARELDSSLPGVATDLAQAHYHLDEIDAARAELDRAERENPDDARMHLYRGLVLLRDAKDEEAAAAFDRAGALDSSLAGVAGLYSGRTWQRVRDRERAAAALERARAAEPGSEWASEAERELENLERLDRRHQWVRLRGGFEYDDNPALRIPGSADTQNLQAFGPFNFGEEDDVRAVFEGELGAELLRDPDNSAGGIVGYDGTAYLDEFHALDLQYPWISAWYDRRLGEDTWMRIQPFGGYAWLETDPFVVHGGSLFSVLHSFTDRISGQLFTRVNVNDYLFRIRPDPVLSNPPFSIAFPGLAEDARRRDNRDGVQTDVGGEGRYELFETDTTFALGSAFEHYEAEGKDWNRNGFRTWVGIRQLLPFDFFLDLDGIFIYHDYDHRSVHDDPVQFASGAGPKRRDRIYQAEAELGYPITDWLVISGRYQYTDNDSNIRVFDWDRHIAGGYLTVVLAN